MIRTMARKNYSEEFRRQAVDLYESTPGATLRGIAADLGIERATLARWVEVYGSGKKTTAGGTTISSSPSGARRRGTRPGAAPEPEPESLEARIARLEAENAQLRAEQTKLTTEREILRQAAKYFAGETNW
jgi:transposase